MTKIARLLSVAIALSALGACADASFSSAVVDPNGATFNGTALAAVRFKIDPTYGELGPAGRYYPERALRMNVRGYAIIACHLAADQKLIDCGVVQETPANLGFGIASVIMAKDGWLSAAAPDAQEPHTPDGWVLVRVDFSAGGGNHRP